MNQRRWDAAADSLLSGGSSAMACLAGLVCRRLDHLQVKGHTHRCVRTTSPHCSLSLCSRRAGMMVEALVRLLLLRSIITIINQITLSIQMQHQVLYHVQQAGAEVSVLIIVQLLSQHHKFPPSSSAAEPRPAVDPLISAGDPWGGRCFLSWALPHPLLSIFSVPAR